MGISIVTDVPDDDALMAEEIFGPIVVILTKEVRDHFVIFLG